MCTHGGPSVNNLERTTKDTILVVLSYRSTSLKHPYPPPLLLSQFFFILFMQTFNQLLLDQVLHFLLIKIMISTITNRKLKSKHSFNNKITKTPAKGNHTTSPLIQTFTIGKIPSGMKTARRIEAKCTNQTTLSRQRPSVIVMNR